METCTSYDASHDRSREPIRRLNSRRGVRFRAIRVAAVTQCSFTQVRVRYRRQGFYRPCNEARLTVADLAAAVLVDDGEYNQAEAQEAPKIEKRLRFVG
jgi:hypothetical protein